jgi:hypothetical protein
MSNPWILIVEDNSILQRQLKELLAQNGLDCMFADNEYKAMKEITKDIRVIVADIELTEKGGEVDGGIKLAKKLSREGWNLPVILISQTPWHYLPKTNSPEFSQVSEKYNIYDILDRNEIGFSEELINKLKGFLH